MKKKLTEKERRQKGLKAGIIAGGIVALLYALIFPLYRVSDFLLCAGLALIIGKVVSIMGQGLDVSKNQSKSPSQKAREAEELPLSGDAQADEVIMKGQEMLSAIRRANVAIPDAKLSAQMDQLENKCAQIFKTVAEKPGKAPQIRKFMNYYLPTTLKMLESYQKMSERGVSESEMTNAHNTLTRGLDMVLQACQKQLDNLYRDTMLDVSTDIDVLEQMLRRDGFTASFGEGYANTAAAEQMNETDAPVLRVPSQEAHTGGYMKTEKKTY